MAYIDDLERAAESAKANLLRHGIPDAKLVFGGEKEVPKTIRVPSFADSKFQAEQALGDWAEGALAKAIHASSNEFKSVHYGFSSRIVAGEEGFNEQYKAGVQDTCKYGKRADLLIVPRELEVPDDISNVPTVATRDIVSKSLGALEVRSSRLEAKVYTAYQAKQLEKKKVEFPIPNFTVKIEDLIIVYRWIELFQRPQAYIQVFLDELHGISVLEIMRYVASAKKLKIVKPKRSSKETIYVPISVGEKIGDVVEYPTFTVVDRPTKNGRHDIFAKPEGGRIEVSSSKVRSLLE